MSQFLTAKQLAPSLHVTPATLLSWHRRGLVPSARAGRRPVLFDPVEVEAAIKGRTLEKPEVVR